MKNFIEMIRNNKTVTGAVVTVLAILIVAIVWLFSMMSDNSKKGTNPTNSFQSTENSESQTTTPQQDTSEKDTTEEPDTTTEETTEETTTPEPVTEPVKPVEYPYLIKVNRAANCTTVYGKDANGNYTVPVKAITVSCGAIVGDTPLGEFNTIISYDWRLLFGNVYGQYSYRIIGSTLFHSVPYYTQSKGDLEWEEYNKLGTSVSAGCVRMPVVDAKWLIDNCPIGTKVIIYDDVTNPGPLGKPETIKIPSDSPYRGWDPTDPDVNNPWHKFSATITYPASKSVSLVEGSAYEQLLANFSAKDTCGNDISHKLKIEGDYDLKTPGDYSIKVHVTDAIGSYVEVALTLNVTEKETTSTTTQESTTSSETTTPSESSTTAQQNQTETTTVETVDTETSTGDLSDDETTSKIE